MNSGLFSAIGAVIAAIIGIALLAATGGVILPAVAILVAGALWTLRGRSRRAARDAQDDPRTRAPAAPLRNDTRTVFVGTGAPDDPLRSKSR